MSDCEEFDLGDDIRITGVFTDPDGEEADPTDVAFKFRAPGDAEATEYIYGTDVQVVKDSTGNYHVDLLANIAGTWFWRWIGTGSIKAGKKGSYRVGEDI